MMKAQGRQTSHFDKYPLVANSINKSRQLDSTVYLCTPDALYQSSHSGPHLKLKPQNPLRVSVTVAERAYWLLPCAAERFRGVATLAWDI